MRAKGMTQSAISAVVWTSLYFFVLENVRSALANRHVVWLWWIILGIYLSLLFVFAFGRDITRRPARFGFGFLLLAAAVYCYDTTINPHLMHFGLEWSWLPFLVGFFLWLYLLVRVGRVEQI